MEKRKMLSGAGSYFQGEHILYECGSELKRRGCYKACVIGGMKALTAAMEELTAGLVKENIVYSIHYFSGFCTAVEIEYYKDIAKKEGSDCLLGVGGGKVIDLTKAVAALLDLPVFTVPTCAATCAAYAALSIVYNDQGCQEDTRYHLNEVSGVFADTHVLANAPARYLAAGMADAMAKSCEYSSMHGELHYGDVDISKYLGYCMARTGDEILLTCGVQAYQDNSRGVVSKSFEDAIYVTIASTGIVSGMGGFAGRTGSRFAIAHGFNEVIRGRYVDTKQWLHGEIVAVGILAQLYANGVSVEYQQRVRKFYETIQIPVTLKDLGIILSDEKFSQFQEEIVTHSGVSKENIQRVCDAVTFVRF